jgi:hypothetical protein
VPCALPRTMVSLAAPFFQTITFVVELPDVVV